MIPRHLLPQIPNDKQDEFCTFLRKNGVKVRLVRLPVEKLRAIQSEVNKVKIDRLKADPRKLALPIIISKTGLILDGHHRWLAAKELNPNGMILCIEADCSMVDLVRLGHEFDGSFTKTVYEVIKLADFWT